MRVNFFTKFLPSKHGVKKNWLIHYHSKLYQNKKINTIDEGVSGFEAPRCHPRCRNKETGLTSTTRLPKLWVAQDLNL